MRERPWLSNFFMLMMMLLALLCCTTKENKQPPTINKFRDPQVREIYELKDRRDTKGLLQHLHQTQAELREEAALALGSVQNVQALPQLEALLSDPIHEVRKAAAFSLGQLYDSAAVNPLVYALEMEKNDTVRKEMLEALGKCITQQQIDLLNQQPADSIPEMEGLAWAFYRAGIRNVYDRVSVQIVASLLDTTYTHRIRLAAAHFFARTKGLDLTDHFHQLSHFAGRDPSPHVRMAATLALKNVNTLESREFIIKNLLKDPDYRVRVNALQALQQFAWEDLSPIFPLLGDSQVQVGKAAAQLVAKKVSPANFEQAKTALEGLRDASVKSILAGALLHHQPDDEVMVKELTVSLEKTADPYQQSLWLSALGKSFLAYDRLVEEAFSTKPKILRTTAMQALVELRQSPDFPASRNEDFADVLKRAVTSEDQALIGIPSTVMQNRELNFKNYFQDPGFLSEAKAKLSLPHDNETLQALQAAIFYFEEKDELPEVGNPFNHPVDWELIGRLDEEQEVSIQTTKGEIVLRLLVEEAPGTVANFVSLINRGYFNGKNFHRVVPNFVIQGGCPRGDGWGGEDYSIRSEFSYQKYGEGSVGMASAGKDTEGTQWFITHSPTPHLDGRYSIFAQVSEGMETVHRIGVGDKIVNVVLL